MKVKLAWTINNLWPSHHYFILTVWSCPYSSCYTSSILFYIDPVKPDIFYPKTTNDSSVSAAGQKSNWSSQIGYVSFNLFTSPMIYEKNISKFMLFSADYRCHSFLFTHVNFLPLCKFFKLDQLFFSHLKPQCQFFRFFFGNIYLFHIFL